ncbi:MAG: hypothetical protein L6276_03005 [Acetobacterium sp.]|nr:hypothetical protein [Bacillota bacterium]MCG2729239.1 hypothetical protein [Acetobacterium sp.]
MLERIKKEIEKKKTEDGQTDSDSLSITLNVTEAQKQKFLQDVENESLDEAWNWDIIGDELRVNYKKEKETPTD